MKISQFTIATEQDDDRNNFLLYNTHTTAFVVLRKDIYMQIFVNRDFSDTQCCDQLKKMGFLVDDDFDELLALEKLRIKGMNDPVLLLFRTRNQTISYDSRNRRCNCKVYKEKLS